MWQQRQANIGIQAVAEAGGREYINVIADYSADGTIRPVSIRFADGPEIAVARVINVIHMSATKQNGAETRYYVRIGDREHYLFFEDALLRSAPRWFVTDSHHPLPV